MKASHTSIVIVAGVLGAALGLGSYTFAYARGWSYLTDNPRACANCHIMNEQYDGWIKSSHQAVARGNRLPAAGTVGVAARACACLRAATH